MIALIPKSILASGTVITDILFLIHACYPFKIWKYSAINLIIISISITFIIPSSICSI